MKRNLQYLLWLVTVLTIPVFLRLAIHFLIIFFSFALNSKLFTVFCELVDLEYQLVIYNCCSLNLELEKRYTIMFILNLYSELNFTVKNIKLRYLECSQLSS